MAATAAAMAATEVVGLVAEPKWMYIQMIMLIIIQTLSYVTYLITLKKRHVY